MENKIKQLRKGILELAILGSLRSESHYGYSLVKAISGEEDIAIAEGTIYPILNRLAKEGLIRSRWVESSQGPPRKYYSLTEEGQRAFDVLEAEYRKLSRMVDQACKHNAAAGPSESGPDLAVSKESDHGR